MSHTPGPWKTCAANDGRCPCGLIWSIPADVVVAELGSEEGSPAHTGDEGAANAALIAAAPDMLAALKAVLEDLGAVRGMDPDTMLKIKDALAEAGGNA